MIRGILVVALTVLLCHWATAGQDKFIDPAPTYSESDYIQETK